MLFICAMVVPGAKVTLYSGYLVSVGISVQAIGFSPWFLMLLHILDSESLMSPFRTTVQVFSALTVYVWYSMFSCLHIALKSMKLFIFYIIFYSCVYISNLLDVYFA